MCGINGLFSYGAAAPPISVGELRATRDYMRARGPDGSGEWCSHDRRVALGHQRLAIIDLSDRASQPMISADGRHVIVFNGEIYNFQELRRTLQAKGCAFRTTSDTEVLMHLYAEMGEDMLKVLRGMFALGVWDEQKRALLLARDTFGVKPLYYSDNGRAVRFASQVKALLAGGNVDTTPEPAGHAGFYLWGSVPEPWTLYKGIRNLPAGFKLWVTSSGPGTPVAFASVSSILRCASQHPRRGNREEALCAVAAAVEKSVQIHQVADVPIGVFLSAGMDSAVISTLLTRNGRRPHSLTLSFAEYTGTANDEAPLAEQVASQLGTRHATIMVRLADFEEERFKFLSAMDQPTIDGVNTWLVAKAAASQGFKVALSGLGGDELFASYPSFSELRRITRLASPFKSIPLLGRKLRQLSLPLLERFTSPKFAGLLEHGGTLFGAYLLRRGLYMPWELPAVLEPELANAGLEELEAMMRPMNQFAEVESDRLAISGLEMCIYMRNQLLRDTDWASMAHSLEVRVPFVDIELIETAMPWFAGRPDMSKRDIAGFIAPQLPISLLSKSKTGFSVPVREWLVDGGLRRAPRGLRAWAKVVYECSKENSW